MALSKMQQAFVHEFVTNPGISQKEAAIRAGCSVKRASVTSSEWMHDPNIKREIDRRLAAKLGTLEKKASSGKVTRESVLQDCAELEDTIKETGMGAWQAQALVKIIELRAKIGKLLTERVELGLDDVLIEKLMEGRKRASQARVIEAQPVPELPAAEAQVAQ